MSWTARTDEGAGMAECGEGIGWHGSAQAPDERSEERA